MRTTLTHNLCLKELFLARVKQRQCPKWHRLAMLRWGHTMILQIRTEAFSYERLYRGTEPSAMPALMLGMLVAPQLHVTEADVESESHLLGTAVELEPRDIWLAADGADAQAMMMLSTCPSSLRFQVR